MRFVSAALRMVLLAPIVVYRRLISPLLPPACRFEPTCSVYAARAIQMHGPVRGAALAARRVCRCHPWSEGGFDPVPGKDAPPDGPAARASGLALKETR